MVSRMRVSFLQLFYVQKLTDYEHLAIEKTTDGAK